MFEPLNADPTYYDAFQEDYELYKLFGLECEGPTEVGPDGFGTEPQQSAEPDEIVPQIFTKSSKTGGYKFPFISAFKDWQVESYKFQMGERGKALVEYLKSKSVTLRIVKDDGITDILIYQKGEVQPFSVLEERGLHIDQPKNPQTGKRLSRMLRLSLAFGSFTPDEMPICEMDVDKDLWDGMNLIAREAVDLLTAHLDWRIQESYKRFHRFEGTVMCPYQVKGHFLVLPQEKMPGKAMIAFPKGSAKEQISFDGIFVDMRPVIGHHHLLVDIQTLINHYSVLFDNETLMQWLHEESVKFLEAMRTGEHEDRMEWLFSEITDLKGYEQLMSMPLFEFLASGGKLHQSATMTRQFGKMWARKLRSKNLNGHRMPIKGGFRLYLAAACTRNLKLKSGECYVDFKRASLFVSDADYPLTVKTLGGADQDDAVNCITDGVTLMATRNPNMRGEYMTYVIHNPEVVGEGVVIDWGLLNKITPISSREYGHLKSRNGCHATTYPEFANWLMGGICAKLGTLGKHINILSACTLTEGDEPMVQPATGEAVIDGSVKDLTIDLSPVIAWDQKQADRLKSKPMCRDAMRRVRGFVGEDYPLKPAKDHWLDMLEDQVEKHIQWFLEQVNHIADQATPCIEAFAIPVNHLGKQLKAVYNYQIRQGYTSGSVDDEDFIEAMKATRAYLDALSLEDQQKALAQAYVLSAFDGKDSVVWQKEIAPITFGALRSYGILGNVEWDGYGLSSDAGTFERTQHIQVNGSWFNILLTTEHYEQMRDVPKPKRDRIKAMVEKNAPGLVGRTVIFEPDGDRILCFNDGGMKLGTVAKDHVDRIEETAVVLHATAHDGNLRLVF